MAYYLSSLINSADEMCDSCLGGTAVFGGLVSEEYSPDLQRSAGLETAVRMRMSDPQVRAVQKILSLPIQATTWFLQEPKEPSAAEREGKELLEGNLFGGMEHSRDDLIREAALAIYFGFRAPEIVWEERAELARELAQARLR